MGGGDYIASAETNAELLRWQRCRKQTQGANGQLLSFPYTVLPSCFGLDISSATYRLTIGRS